MYILRNEILRGLLLTILLLLFSSPALAEMVVACPNRVELGQPFAVRVTSSESLADISIEWLDKTIPVSVSTWNGKSIGLTLLGTDILKTRPGSKQVVIAAEQDGRPIRLVRTVRVVGQKTSTAKKVQKLKVEKKMATPPKSVLTKIAEDRNATGQALGLVSQGRNWHLPFARPVPGIITSPYGVGRIFNGKRRNPHRGLDFQAAQGDPIRAACDGRVTLVGDHYFAGTSVYIDHGQGVTTLYFHLSRADVQEGQTVRRGQAIGHIGSTGRVTGPHLHFSVSVLGQLVDPLPLLEKGTDRLLADRK